VQPPEDAARGAQHLPPVTQSAPRVQTPLPPSAQERGGLVAGYPTDLAAPAADSEVLDSAVASEGDVLQFSLRARTAAAGADVLAHYRTQLSGQGLAAATADAGSVAFRDAYSSVVVTAEQSGTGVVYTIHGVLRAG
jgi:hypothetical protein